MALGKRTKNEIVEVAIRDWRLNEIELHDTTYFLDAQGILQIYSQVDAEECRKLLRAIVHTWLNYDLAKSGIPLHDKELRKRERNLRIKYIKMATFEWSWKLQEIANLYNQFEGRARHNAKLVIMGNEWKFESQLRDKPYGFEG